MSPAKTGRVLVLIAFLALAGLVSAGGGARTKP